MNRLTTELQRLYGTDPVLTGPAGGTSSPLDDGEATTRRVVLEIRRPTSWERVATLWQALLQELGLPTPALTINGVNGFQLWFALRDSTPIAQAAAWADALRHRYLSDIPAHQCGQFPAWAEDGNATARPVTLAIPAESTEPGHWSAFIAPGLAPMFADDPWLDMPPSVDAQADLLTRLDTISRAEWDRTLGQLGVGRSGAKATPDQNHESDGRTAEARNRLTQNPREFLLAVMNDSSVALTLRIDAAKALLPYN